MKKLITLVAILGAFSAQARNVQINKSLKVKSSVSEADLVLKAEALIPGIVNFTNKMIRKEAAYANCTRRTRDIALGSFSATKVFVSKDDMTLTPVYVGRLGYTFKRCQDND